MASVGERFRGVSGDQQSRRIEYIVRDAIDDQDALDALEGSAPLSYDNLPRENIDVEELSEKDGLYLGTALYSRRKLQAPETSTSEYSFEYGTQGQRIIQSYNTLATYTPAGKSAINFGGAIAVDAEGTPQGVDVQVPTGSFAVTYYPPNATVTLSYQNTVQDLIGKVNNATFYGRAAGEALFVGCTGRTRNSDDWELTYRFQVRKNQTGITIGTITGINVGGWEVVWVYYENDVDNAAKKFIQKPRQVNVERIYEQADFSVLGI